MNEFAMRLGYVVMAIGGIISILLLLIGLMAAWWKYQKMRLSLPYVHEAIAEWQERHPEKARTWFKRQGREA